MSFLKQLFSIEKYDINHKKITILGIEIKCKCKSDVMEKYKDLPIQNNKIVFRHHFGSYACNVKYITEEILKQNLPYELVWIVNEHILKFIKDFPSNVRLVMTNTPEAYKEYATAKIWIDTGRRNTFISKGLNKREGQIYIQTWHGSLGIKKTAPDRNDIPKRDLKKTQIDASQIDYLTSNGKYTTDFFKRIFWNNGAILEVGHPRNDVFFKDNKKIKEKVYRELNIPINKKIILYAPTFREDKDFSCHTLDFNNIVNTVSKRFGNEYVVALRIHPLILELKDKYAQNFNDIIDATDYSDMQELLAASDIVITDYSSCVYDFMLQYKPAFIFATDVKKYDNDRGLYYPLTSTPFPVAETNEELVEKIENFDYENYKKNVAEFLKGKGCIDDGHASERVVELIKNIISKAEQENMEAIK